MYRAVRDSCRRLGAWLPLERAGWRSPRLRHHRRLPLPCLSKFMTSPRFSDVAISLAQRRGKQLECQPAVEIKSSTSSLGRELVVVVPHPPRRHPDDRDGSEGNPIMGDRLSLTVLAVAFANSPRAPMPAVPTRPPPSGRRVLGPGTVRNSSDAVERFSSGGMKVRR